MRPLSIFIVSFALLLAGAVFVVVPRAMNRAEPTPPAPPAQRIAAGDVLVAARNIPAGTILKGGDVRWQRWPDEGLDANFLIRDKGATIDKNAVGRVVLRGFAAGEPITTPRLLKSGEAGFLAAALTPGMRAVTVRIDAVSGDGGFIVPGDRVDVLLAERYPITYSGSDAGFTGTRPTHKQVNSVVLRDVRVLAIDQETRDIDAKPRVGSTATLEVSLVQAQKIALAPQMGALSLVLRSFIQPEEPDMAGGTIQDTEVSSYLGGLVGRPARAAAVRVYRGSAMTGQGN